MTLISLANEKSIPNVLSAQSLFIQGEYDQALDQARSLETVEGLTLAAEIASSRIMLGLSRDKIDEAKMARRFAEAALDIDPDSQAAQLQYVLAYGFETRSSSPMRAWRKGLIKKSRRAIETYQTKFPDDPKGDALMAAWHLGIFRRLDEKRAEDWFGASKSEGMRLYQNAMQTAPEDLVIAGNYAITLLSLDMLTYKKEAFAVIADMAKMEPRNAVERDVKAMIIMLPNYTSDEILQKRVDELLE